MPVGLLTAVFLSKAAPAKLRTVSSAAGELLAGIPSVVYGLVGMLVLVPAIRQDLFQASGRLPAAAIIVLSIMILPSIINVSVTALNAVPPEYEEGSLALGATETETMVPIGLPAAEAALPRRWCWASAAPSARPWP